MAGTFFPVKWTPDPHQRFVADMEIYFRGFRIAMSKKGLDMLPVYSLFHPMCCKAVAQAVWSCLYRKLGI